MEEKNINTNTQNSAIKVGEQIKINNFNYTINKIAYYDDETTNYICSKDFTNVKVIIREFFPRSISTRNENGQKIYPNLGREIQYKTIMGDIEALWKQMKKMPQNPCLPNVLDICEMNNTVYAVCEKIDHKNVYEKIQEQGPFIWANIKNGFIKLCDTINDIHNIGIIHRGISDKTVLITDDNNFIITSFSTDANRSIGTELSATLFENYSAPEQYDTKMWQSCSTDIYSLACLLYMLLTGEQPQKDENGMIKEAISVNPKIPEYISDAISACTVVNTKYRTDCVNDFIAMLLEDTSSNTAVFEAPKLYGKNDTKVFGGVKINENTSEPVTQNTIVLSDFSAFDNGKKKKNKVFIYIFYIISVTLILFFWFGPPINYDTDTPEDIISSQESEEIFESVPFDSYKIDNFVGQKAKEVIENEENTQKYKFYIREDYSDTYPRGEIISQIPKGGVKAVNRANMIITISKGTRTIVMPDVNGKNVDDVSALLKKYGLTFKIVEIYNNNQKPGIVVNCNIDAGAAVDIFDDVVIIYVSKSSNK